MHCRWSELQWPCNGILSSQLPGRVTDWLMDITFKLTRKHQIIESLALFVGNRGPMHSPHKELVWCWICFLVTNLRAISHMMSCIIYNKMPVHKVIPFHVMLQQLGITCKLREKITNYLSWNQLARTFGHCCHMTWVLNRNTITLHKSTRMLDRVTHVPGNNKVRLKMSNPDVEPTSEEGYYSWRVVITFIAIVDYTCSSILRNCCLCMYRGS